MTVIKSQNHTTNMKMAKPSTKKFLKVNPPSNSMPHPPFRNAHGFAVAPLRGSLLDHPVRPSARRTRNSASRGTGRPVAPRSEEHTSELQSRPHLVCRLL